MTDVNPAVTASSGGLQSREMLLDEAILWLDQHLRPVNLKVLLLARLPAQPTGGDVEDLVKQLGINLQGSLGYGKGEVGKGGEVRSPNCSG